MTEEQVPDRVGAYRVLARLGEGGMGVVYRGRSPGGRAVAIKVIRESFAADPEFRARFRREVAAAARVTGAFTAPVLDADPEAAEPWLVTAYLPGLSLREAVSIFGELPEPAVRQLAAGLAEALVEIHRAGLAHRDLKPGNIMLTADGPKVIDFGIARPEDATSITRIGRTIGTPGFMSPEQASGHLVEPASDLFSLGSVLIFAATGHEPFGEGDTRTVQQRVQRAQADLRGITAPWLLDLLALCQRLDPAERPAAAWVLDRLGAEPAADTAWLPAPIAEEIGRRATHARETTGESEVSTEPSPETSRMAEETVDPPALPAEDTPAEPRWRFPISRRDLLVGGALAVGSAAAAIAGARLLRPGEPEAAAGPATAAPPPSTSPTPPPAGIVKWRTKVSDYYPEVHRAGGVIVGVGQDRGVHGLDAATGRPLWRKEGGNESGATGDVVYLGSPLDPWFSTLDPATGAFRWAPKPNHPGLGIRVAAHGGQVFLGYDKVHALGGGDGRIRWTVPVTCQRGLYAVNGQVLAVDDKHLTALDPGNGRTRWRHAVQEEVYHVGSGEGLVLLVDNKLTLFALAADTGQERWQKRAFWISSTPVAGNGMVYICGGRGEVQGLRADNGEIRWSRTIGADCTLGLDGDTLYAASARQKIVHALSALDSRIRWTHQVDIQVQPMRTGQLLAAGGVLYLGNRAGEVEAVIPPEGARAGS